ncbi:HAD family hydrolase [Kribbella sandramycini]|uniref:FMN phosphatase YigB (HAD superfamily) n=1 Tax=Kribbella sandramycini TaxID=60450 RepID=A0A7Y4KY39_9ACTN|nr:HAD family hydrolase [Kribbella sandramycini]MBB6569362.1 FMN phosphatase YigB (HAD superfamily) [Kribbella sandramycini]NOL40799.1 HAD family hydrolase [Kribbella sandramycini]
MPAPGLACFDLDNTLIDRNAAFRAWSISWCGQAGLPDAAVTWLVAHDNDGFHPRAELFEGLRRAFGSAPSVDDYDREHPLFTFVNTSVLTGLTRLRTTGWRIAVVTNGSAVQQRLKLEHTGIAAAVDACCVSEELGVRKPDLRIFELAAERAGAPLKGGWMVGDQPAHDVLGGQNAGLRTVLVGERGGDPAADYRVPDVVRAIELILE